MSPLQPDDDLCRPLLDTPLRRDAGAPALQRQLYHRVREAILTAALAAGSRLPGSRSLAEALGVSRNTVTAAYEQLAAEGFLTQTRSGTKVAELARSSTQDDAFAMPALAMRVGTIQPEPPLPTEVGRFRPGVPALSLFPRNDWRRAVDHAMRRRESSLLGYGNPLGELSLRTAIARHLSVTRGVRCVAGQIVITDGAQTALSLCVAALTNPGELAWIEDPGYRGARAAMRAGDLTVHPMPVDEQGIVVGAEDWRLRTPRLVYTTPSHQYPCGGVLSAGRRLELIDAAKRHGAWLIEDDYDSEFRHAGEPLGAMQGLVNDAPVLYVGTFSKTMFPALRIGFLVLPCVLVQELTPALNEMLRGVSTHLQLALADFIEHGHYARHLARMRRIYRDRQQALRVALKNHFVPDHQVEGGLCGLHLTIRLPARYPDRDLVEAARAYGMTPYALSGFAMARRSQDNGLVLGYGNTSSDTFEPSLRLLSGLAEAIARR